MDVPFLIFLVVTVAAVGIPAAITLWGGRSSRRMRESLERQCTAEATGTVTRIDPPAHGDPSARIHVEYEVEGRVYRLTETLKLKARDVQNGSYMFNITKLYAIDGLTGAGDRVAVRYAPRDPALAYLPENDGLMER